MIYYGMNKNLTKALLHVVCTRFFFIYETFILSSFSFLPLEPFQTSFSGRNSIIDQFLSQNLYFIKMVTFYKNVNILTRSNLLNIVNLFMEYFEDWPKFQKPFHFPLVTLRVFSIWALWRNFLSSISIPVRKYKIQPRGGKKKILNLFFEPTAHQKSLTILSLDE